MRSRFFLLPALLLAAGLRLSSAGPLPPTVPTVPPQLTVAVTPAADPATDVAKLATEFLKVGSYSPGASCTLTAVDGTKFVCHGLTTQGAWIPPFSFFCEPSKGCWMPPGIATTPSGN